MKKVKTVTVPESTPDKEVQELLQSGKQVMIKTNEEMAQEKAVKEEIEKAINSGDAKPAMAYICPHCKVLGKDGVFPNQEALEAHLKMLTPMDLRFQWYIEKPPVNVPGEDSKQELLKRAVQSDDVTINTWREKWRNNIVANSKLYNFKENSVGKLEGEFYLKPCIVAGSGPSLRTNAHELKDRGGIPLVSCLHNFGYFEDLGVMPDYYMNLDAGPITLPEVSEGGVKDEEHYWKQTKKHKLLCVSHAHPEMLKKWQGEIYFFTSLPDAAHNEDTEKAMDGFAYNFATGGHALGACMYFAKAVAGANPIAYVGADYSFGYDKQFHAWKSQYDDKFSGLMPATDIFGHRRYTWISYYNFKCWLEFIAMKGRGNTPGNWYNCTEGGILGAYPEGNLIQLQLSSLRDFIDGYIFQPKHLKKALKCKAVMF